MKLWSDSWPNGERIPAKYACGRLDAAAGTAFSDNVNPHLAWSDLPAATKSLVLICHDFDVPSRGDDVNQAGREIPADLPRVDFFHWLLADVPLTTGRSPRARSARASRARGKPGPAVTVPGLRRRAPGHQRLHRLVRRQSGARGRLLRLRRPVSAVERLARPPLRVHAVRALGRARAGRRALRRRRAAQGDRRATCSPRRCTPAPTRSIAGSDEVGRRSSARRSRFGSSLLARRRVGAAARAGR